MSSSEFSIRVEGLSKRYEIYGQPVDRLKQMTLPRIQRTVRRSVRTYFKEFWALRDVSFDVRRGETVGIVGRNGSGKSTLLQMICGTLHPTSGQISVSGRIAALLELGAGFNPEFTGRENVYLSGLLYGISEGELQKRYQAIVDFADIGEFIDQPVKTYSSGMYVRLAFAIIAHIDADTLVIDEALSVGDVRFTQKCMRFLRSFQARGTLLFVSHDAGAVINLCQRAIWLDGGGIVTDGPARDVVEQYLAEQHAADRSSLGERVAVRAAAQSQSSSEGRSVLAEKTSAQPEFEAPCLGSASSGIRNSIEVFEFNPDAVSREFGAGAAHIDRVSLQSASGNSLASIMGGELVDLTIEATAVARIESPIFGFYVKDRLGQQLFGDNSYLIYRDKKNAFDKGSKLRARFRFRMPILAIGSYTVDAAVATGTQDDHTQQHWIRDALVFKATESSMRHGLVGVPMQEIEIERLDAVHEIHG
jgi:lipopolysaccharide transport system ATP-binding protein